MNEPTSLPTRKAAPSAPVRTASPFGAPMDWLRSEIDQLFDSFGQPATSLFNFGRLSPSAPVPAVELVEDGKSYKLTAELPGLTEQDIDVSVAGDVLTITGEKKESREQEEKGVLISERRYGSFRRQIPLPADVDHQAITAQFKDGILNVTLAKDENVPARSRKIEIGKG
ncbi:Hsp20/alpha crystallin family protein (plasmid) [Sphingobium naphthae]|uniref:Hsp20/alpha crystallin family protein n=1 Tax=Sphingobium naphthae TaxID=1886786 RepID=UPI002B0944B2|nr:Hsp20/alpha crystallin family protein [Pseudomonadota bacterium]